MGFAPKTLIKSRRMRGQTGNFALPGLPHFPVGAREVCKKLEEVWHTPARTWNASTKKQRYGILGQPGLQTKFEDNLGYVVKSCFKINFKEINKDSQKD